MPCLCATTRLAARSITRFYEAELRQAGVLAPQFWLLQTLSHASEGGQINQRDLLADLAMDQSTLSRNLAVMVKNGWINGEDKGRERLYKLTASGRAALKRAQPHWKRAQDKMQQALGSDWDLAMQALTRIASATGDLSCS